MSDEWLTTPGERGEITVRCESDDDRLLVETDLKDGPVILIAVDETSFEVLRDGDRIDIEVEKFTDPGGSGPCFLVATRATEGTGTGQLATTTETGADARTSEPDQEADTTPNASNDADTDDDDAVELADLRGSGEYVTVEAWVNHIIPLNTDDPMQKGLLGDDSVKDGIPFVIYRESDVDRLSKGEKYRFVNVRDHEYDEGKEIQVLVGKHSRVFCLTQ